MTERERERERDGDRERERERWGERRVGHLRRLSLDQLGQKRERDGKRVQERERERREPLSPSVIGSAVVVTR